MPLASFPAQCHSVVRRAPSVIALGAGQRRSRRARTAAAARRAGRLSCALFDAATNWRSSRNYRGATLSHTCAPQFLLDQAKAVSRPFNHASTALLARSIIACVRAEDPADRCGDNSDKDQARLIVHHCALNKRDPNRSRGLPVGAGYLAAEAPQRSSMSATDPRSSGAIWASS